MPLPLLRSRLDIFSSVVLELAHIGYVIIFFHSAPGVTAQQRLKRQSFPDAI